MDTLSLSDSLEDIIAASSNGHVEVSSDRTLELLKRNQVISPSEANSTVQKALNENGATIEACASVLSFIILNTNEKGEVRRKAVADALALHRAVPEKHDVPQNVVQVLVQSSDHINLARVLNPNPRQSSQ